MGKPRALPWQLKCAWLAHRALLVHRDGDVSDVVREDACAQLRGILSEMPPHVGQKGAVLERAARRWLDAMVMQSTLSAEAALLGDAIGMILKCHKSRPSIHVKYTGGMLRHFEREDDDARR